MKEIKIKLPDNCDIDNISTKIENGCLVVLCKPKKEFKFGDYVKFDNSQKIGIVIDVVGDLVTIRDTNNKVQFVNTGIIPANTTEINAIKYFLYKNNLRVDYENQSIVKKRWRVEEKHKSYYYINQFHEVKEDYDGFMGLDNDRYNTGNYFKTREQAEKVAREIRDVFERHQYD